MNSYQRLQKKNKDLKKENLDLMRQLSLLSNDPDCQESISIKAHWIFMLDLGKTIWFGDRNNKGGGLRDQIHL